MRRFSKILFVFEPSAENAQALNTAVELARNNQAELVLMGCVEASDSSSGKRLIDCLVAEREEQLKKILDIHSVTGINVESAVAVGYTFVEVIRKIQKSGCDLVIKSLEKDRDKSIGGTDMKLLRKTPCPVWLIRSPHRMGDRQILVALEYDPENPECEPLNRQLLEMASSLALSEFAELHIVHAWSLSHEDSYRSPRLGLSTAEVDEMVADEESKRQRWLADLVRQYCVHGNGEDDDYLQPVIHLRKGSARHVVPNCARELGADLVVMGTVARTGIPGFFIGNTAEHILRCIESSILAVKPPGFVSPVSPT